MGFTKATGDYIDQSTLTGINAGIDWQTTPKTSDFTAVSGEGYLVDTTSAAITVTLPTTPSSGDEISLIDYSGNASTNIITLTSNDNIQGSTNDKAINNSNSSVKLFYSGATRGWLVESNAVSDSISTALPSSFSVDYLVVAGGGGTDLFSGGGGAGGLRTSFSGSTNGGGSNLESTLTLSTNVAYNITVGSGGSGLGYVSPGGTATGSDSVFHNITSNGGGGGSYQTGPTGGGSGGGAGCGSNPGSYTGGTRSTTPTIQGYNGGDSGPRNGSGYPCGGGGGAGAAGQDYVSGTQAGNGGVGLSNSITGSAVFYAGGGGGAVINNYTAGTGGNGGGGNGGNGTTTGTNGADNTGGGGGGAPNTPTTGNNGGSGVVILRYPTGYTLSGVTGSTTTVGVYDVTTFTAGTGTITFS
jgi:hypothetical protein